MRSSIILKIKNEISILNILFQISFVTLAIILFNEVTQILILNSLLLFNIFFVLKTNKYHNSLNLNLLLYLVYIFRIHFGITDNAFFCGVITVEYFYFYESLLIPSLFVLSLINVWFIFLHKNIRIRFQFAGTFILVITSLVDIYVLKEYFFKNLELI